MLADAEVIVVPEGDVLPVEDGEPPILSGPSAAASWRVGEVLTPGPRHDRAENAEFHAL